MKVIPCEDDSLRGQDIPGFGWSNGALPAVTIYNENKLQNRVQLYESHRRWISTVSFWSRTGQGSPNDSIGSALLGEKLPSSPLEEARVMKALICQLCEAFHSLGWMPGTGGGMSMRSGNGQDIPFRIYSTPSGLQKEDMIGDDIFEMDMEQNIVRHPNTPGLHLSSMTCLWFVVYKHRPSTNCVIHTHSMNAQLATLIDEDTETLRVTNLEMLKGVGNHAYDDELLIPIIPNKPSEDQLKTDFERVIQKYPKCNAVLVRRHGVYVWGDSWEQAKTQLESFDYLFETVVNMKRMGIDCGKIPKNRQNDD